jgi:HlyD family secretion protein
VTEVLVYANDRVRKDQVLARLDLSKLQDAVARSRAGLISAQAQVQQAEATTGEARAALARYRQVSQLSGGKVPSQAEMDAAEADLKRAEAGQAVARAAVVQARANLQSDETNLGKGSIRSPIDGVVLARNVEPGQTVAAMFQAPVLFTLAEDLSKMELQVDIDEADVGRVEVGQRATFGVDAWPGRRFTGVITRVDYGSQTKDGVVSYPAVLAVANDDLRLRPGMTGTADIVTLTREGALLVPNSALRYTPSASASGNGGPGGSGFLGHLLPRPPGQPHRPAAPPADGRPRVWVLHDGRPAPIEVETGDTNGQVTEIVAGPLEAGAQVITEELQAAP